MALLKVLEFAQTIVGSVLTPGAVAVDATLGNGHDALFLASRVGARGQVFGFDVQAAALRASRARLAQAGMAERVQLYHRGHEYLAEVLPSESRGQVQAVMFNLGYLPGAADRSCITRPETTLPALDAALKVLAPEGVITVVVYEGHPGGALEGEAVAAWAAALDPQAYRAVSYRFVNVPSHPPWLLAVQRQP